MSDADRLRTISRRWSNMYEKVCEGYFNNASLADEAMIPLRRDIEDYGNSLFSLLKRVSIRLEDIRGKPLFLHDHNWNEEDQYIIDLAFDHKRRYKSPQRGIDLFISASKGLIHKLRNGELVAGNLKEALFSDYFRGIYDSNFTEKVILTIDNREDIDRGLIIQKLNEVGICVNERINDLASQVAKKGRLVRSRRNRSKPKKAITIEDNVFDLGNEL